MIRYYRKGKGNPQHQKGNTMKEVKSLEIITLSNGYYVKRILSGNNVTMTFCKTKTEANKLMKTWKAAM